MRPPSRSVVVVGDDWLKAQRLPGDRSGGQNTPDIIEAHPCPRVHCPSRTLPQVVVHPIYHA